MPFGYDDMYHSIDCICTCCGSVNVYFLDLRKKRKMPCKYSRVLADCPNCGKNMRSIVLGDSSLVIGKLNYTDEDDLSPVELKIKKLIKRKLK